MRAVEAQRTAHATAEPGRDEDVALLASIAAGERSALTALYGRWRRSLFAFLLTQTSDRAVAEEILQDTLVAVWQHADRFEGRARVSTWLFGIASRQAWNRLRRRAPEPVGDVDLTAVPAVDAGPEDVVVARERVTQVAAAMARLSPLHREVLVLAFDGRLSYDEIADVLDVPIGTVRSRQQRRRQVAALLDEVGLGDVAGRKLKRLSGGMRRRVGIAQALLNDPRLLIVDEPTAGLDPEERIRFRTLLARLGGDRTVLLSTHIVDDVAQTCRHLAVLADGRVRFGGTVPELTALAAGHTWSVTAPPGPPPAGPWTVVSALHHVDGVTYRVVGQPPDDLPVAPAEPSLEDGYVRLMQTAALAASP